MAATTDALLDRLTSAPAEAGLFLDFDGVLAPIVPRPEDAQLMPGARAELLCGECLKDYKGSETSDDEENF